MATVISLALTTISLRFLIGVNLGGQITNQVNLLAIIGIEDLESEAPVDVNFPDTEDESSVASLMGIGAAL